jgi:transposase
MQSLHRVRERWVMRRTAVINQIRGLLLERGITLRKGRCHVGAALPGILEDADAKLSGALRMLLAQLKLELDHLDMRIDEANALIKKTACENEACQRLVAIPGIGPVTATAVIAAIGNGGAFHKGREFAAWMGVVPREHSTGGQQKLLGISKRGNSYLRRLLRTLFQRQPPTTPEVDRCQPISAGLEVSRLEGKLQAQLEHTIWFANWIHVLRTGQRRS